MTYNSIRLKIFPNTTNAEGPKLQMEKQKRQKQKQKQTQQVDLIWTDTGLRYEPCYSRFSCFVSCQQLLTVFSNVYVSEHAKPVS